MEKLDLGNIIEIQQIKNILSKDKNLLIMFNQLLKIVNKKVNNENIDEIIDETDTEKSFSIYSDSESDDEVFKNILDGF
tara:strand:+ start:391 stop:627 length:237 start_codon:yes stop_codon:yes gene_type:complete